MRRLAITLLILSTLLLYGCAHVTVKDINSDTDNYLGKKVVVSGRAIAPMQFGQVSGFTLKDGSASIMISSDTVPKADTQVTVKGTVVKGLFTQHYIFADEITEDS